MKGKRFLALVLLAAAGSALPEIRAYAQPAPAPETGAAEVDQLRNTLFNARTPRERDEAARRLMQRGEGNGANAVLHDALRSGNSFIQWPVARALADGNNSPPEFLGDLLGCLQPQITPELAEAVSLALASYRDNPVARDRLRGFILSGNIGEVQRAKAVRAMGTLDDKDTAQFLLTVLRGEDPNITLTLSDAAADALVDMTGLTEYGHDFGQWNSWWESQRNKSPQQFQADRTAERAAAALRNQGELAQIAKEIRSFAQDNLNLTDAKASEAYILKYLKSQAPKFRAVGAGLVNILRNNGKTVSPAVIAQLREMISDSDSDVRKSVADAIFAVNDSGSAKILLVQLQRERLPDVKASIIKALGPTKDLDAVPELIRLLGDPSFNVASASAEALAELGPEVAKNQTIMRRVSDALSAVLQNTLNVRGSGQLRAKMAEAMIPLKDPELFQPLVALLQDRENNPPTARIAAIHALSAMNAAPARQADIAGRLADTLLRDRDKGVRLEAAAGMGVVGGPGQKQALINAMSPAVELDPVVRETAWNSLVKLFPQFGVNELFDMAQTFKDAPERQLAVEKALLNKNLPAGDRAAVEETIGVLNLTPAVNRPEAAIDPLTDALNYWDGQTPAARTEGIQNSLLDAYLRAKRYKDSVKFSAARLEKGQNPESMLRRFRREIDNLSKNNEVRPALDLVTDVLTLPVRGTLREELVDLQKDLRSRVLPFYDRHRERWIGIFARAGRIKPALG